MMLATVTRANPTARVRPNRGTSSWVGTAGAGRLPPPGLPRPAEPAAEPAAPRVGGLPAGAVPLRAGAVRPGRHLVIFKPTTRPDPCHAPRPLPPPAPRPRGLAAVPGHRGDAA